MQIDRSYLFDHIKAILWLVHTNETTMWLVNPYNPCLSLSQKYGDKDLGVRGVGDNKRGPSAFHPGYKHFRASSWAKVSEDLLTFDSDWSY